MRLFIDTHYFISVIEQDGIYNCQIMELIHDMGMHRAYITDLNQSDVISSIVYDSDVFKTTSKICKDLKELADFHLECLLAIQTK